MQRMIPLPAVPSAETLCDPARRLATTDSRFLLIYCNARSVGAMFDFSTGLWACTSPVTVGEFLASLRLAAMPLPSDDDLSRWAHACCPIEAEATRIN